MAKNITYLLGAGASYNACPILNEQGEKMIELAHIFKKLKNDGAFDKNERIKSLEETFENMESFGKKAKKFGTIDNYTTKLNLNKNNSIYELERLKIAVSLFFTIWQLTNNEQLKTLENRKILEIDSRYTSLLAKILEKNENNIVIKENINFVTWNYDLQLEYAFKSFYQDITWENLSKKIKFRIDDKNSKLQICHLNGYHGFYKITPKENETNSIKEHHFLERTNSKKIEDIINKIAFIPESQNRGTIDINDYINYAWEESDIASNTRKEAKRIFKQTDILIIIGYSFPRFNKDIDSSLFKELGRKTEIYYQDPKATDEFVSQLLNMDNSGVNLKKELYQFFLPYSF
jgi:hypothetical protein